MDVSLPTSSCHFRNVSQRFRQEVTLRVHDRIRQEHEILRPVVDSGEDSHPLPDARSAQRHQRRAAVFLQ